MENLNYFFLETASIDELKLILNSINKNVNIIALDFSFSNDIIDELIDVFKGRNL